MAGDISRLGDVGSEAPLGPGADCGQSARAGGARLHLPQLHDQSGSARVRSCRSRHRLLRLPRTFARSYVGTMRLMPRDLGHWVAHDKGRPVASPRAKVAFHQQLSKQNCMTCHRGHEGSALAFGSRASFSHDLLLPAVSAKCETCHTPPDTTIHRGMSANCGQCHSQQRWKPAKFDHAKLFLLEGDHNVACATCHVDNDTSRYTCFGCHEHQPDGIRAKHLREGISNFENCVQCHRSAHGEHGSGEQGKDD